MEIHGGPWRSKGAWRSAQLSAVFNGISCEWAWLVENEHSLPMHSTAWNRRHSVESLGNDCRQQSRQTIRFSRRNAKSKETTRKPIEKHTTKERNLFGRSDATALPRFDPIMLEQKLVILPLIVLDAKLMKYVFFRGGGADYFFHYIRVNSPSSLDVVCYLALCALWVFKYFSAFFGDAIIYGYTSGTQHSNAYACRINLSSLQKVPLCEKHVGTFDLPVRDWHTVWCLSFASDQLYKSLPRLVSLSW